MRASMGPPLKAAENVVELRRVRVNRNHASMGPPLKAAENSTQTKENQIGKKILQWGRR